jgi:hypothetical protein
VIVEVSELGTRPAVFTKSRAFAPEAAKALSQYLSKFDWADKAFVILDWDNSLQLQPEDAAIPILVIQIVKGEPGYGLLRMEWKWDVDDIFGTDSMTPTLLVDLVEDMRVAVEEAVAARRSN